MKVFNKIADISLMVCFIIMNVMHLLFTLWVIIEQFSMSGAGTNMEMVVLLPFILEICTLPAIIFEIVCLIIFKGKFKLANIVFFVLFIAQTLIFNVLIYV